MMSPKAGRVLLLLFNIGLPCYVLANTPMPDAADLLTVGTAEQAAFLHSPDASAESASHHQQQQEPSTHRQLLQAHKPYVVAHRGASGPLPEHTAPAYLMAIDQGADFIECDVVVTKDLKLICRHEPNLNDTTDVMDRFGDRINTYVIDGQAVTGVFAADLTLAEVQQLRARQRWPFRNHSFDGLYSIVTLEDFISLAQAAGRPVGIYPEAKHPKWHNQLPALVAAGVTIEDLMVQVLHAKGYATSAPHGSAAWRSRPVYIQSFEVTSLRRFAALTPIPLALLLDKGSAPDTGLSLEQMVSDAYLAQLSPFVTVVAPWKALLYTLVDRVKSTSTANTRGLVALPAVGANGTDTSRRRLAVADIGVPKLELGSSIAGGFDHPDVPLGEVALQTLQQTQQLQSTGLTERLHKHGFQVHTYTLRDESAFVMPTCGVQGISCEFEWLFSTEGLDGAFADWPGTMVQWLQHWQP